MMRTEDILAFRCRSLIASAALDRRYLVLVVFLPSSNSPFLNCVSDCDTS